jgi:hypothetical protein
MNTSALVISGLEKFIQTGRDAKQAGRRWRQSVAQEMMDRFHRPFRRLFHRLENQLRFRRHTSNWLQTKFFSHLPATQSAACDMCSVTCKPVRRSIIGAGVGHPA